MIPDSWFLIIPATFIKLNTMTILTVLLGVAVTNLVASCAAWFRGTGFSVDAWIRFWRRHRP